MTPALRGLRKPTHVARLTTLAAVMWLLALPAATTQTPGARFEIVFTSAAHSDPITGRVYVAISRNDMTPPIRQAGSAGAPLFGVDVEALKPGDAAVSDGRAFGHPVRSVNDIPAGEYVVQAFVNVYTRFARADGHTVWLHMDQWEGQNWRRSPGNLFSTPIKVRVDPKAGSVVRLTCDQVIPPIAVPVDTEYVKHLKFESRILSKWWGHPIFIGATILLPKDYAKHPDVRYPVNYIQGHFSTGAPGGFGRGGDFDKYWLAEDTPRFVYVTFQHPTPYYDDSYAVNSENNGPYGDAILEELIPAVERGYRVIREPWARQLSGGSTGGWEALALQIFHPEFFGGTWASCPDSIDFRCHQVVDIYKDDNAYWIDKGWTKVERPNQRTPDGNIVSMMKDENWFELAAGDHSRSGGQWDIWEATYGPVGEDGYPKRIWDKRTGTIDHDVAAYWKTHYDLRSILETNWATLGPKLVGKLHIYVGDQDSFYLNDAVGLMEAFLAKTTNPAYEGTIKYERLRPHCWGPGGPELLQLMTAHLEKIAPRGADLTSWKYR